MPLSKRLVNRHHSTGMTPALAYIDFAGHYPGGLQATAFAMLELYTFHEQLQHDVAHLDATAGSPVNVYLTHGLVGEDVGDQLANILRQDPIVPGTYKPIDPMLQLRGRMDQRHPVQFPVTNAHAAHARKICNVLDHALLAIHPTLSPAKVTWPHAVAVTMLLHAVASVNQNQTPTLHLTTYVEYINRPRCASYCSGSSPSMSWPLNSPARSYPAATALSAAQPYGGACSAAAAS